MGDTKFNQTYIKKKKLFMLKNKNEHLTGFGPIWLQFELGQWLRHKKMKQIL